MSESQFQALRGARFVAALMLAVLLQRQRPHARLRGSWQVDGGLWFSNLIVLGAVLETLQRLEAEGRPAFDPYRVPWRSDRLEWVMKNGFADWFAGEMRASRVFFPLTVGR